MADAYLLYAAVPALAMTPTIAIVIAVVSVLLLGVAWFGIKFWLASTRPPNIQEVRTPNLDRLNQQALAALGDEDEEDEEAVEGLGDAAGEPGKSSGVES